MIIFLSIYQLLFIVLIIIIIIHPHLFIFDFFTSILYMISCLNAFAADMIKADFESIIGSFYLFITPVIITIILIFSLLDFASTTALDLMNCLILSLMVTYFITLDDSTRNKIVQCLLISITQLTYSLDYELTEIYSHLHYLD